MRIFHMPWVGLAIDHVSCAKAGVNDILVQQGMGRDFLALDYPIDENSWSFLHLPSSPQSLFQYARFGGTDVARPLKRRTNLNCASSSSAPPPRSTEASPAEEDGFRWDKLSLGALKRLLISERPQDIRQAALAVIIDRYQKGEFEALLTLAACTEKSEGARIKLHDIMASNDIAYRHMQQLYRKFKDDPKKHRSLFFAFRSLADRVNDLIADDFKLKIAAGEMIPLSDNKVRYFNAVISNLYDGDLSDWAKAGSDDAAEELLIRYLITKDSDDPEEKDDSDSALVELAEAARHNEHAQDILLKTGAIDTYVWGELDRLAIDVPNFADRLFEIVETGQMGNYFASLCGAAVQSPHAALLLCDLAEGFHKKKDFHRRDRILLEIKEVNLVRYRVFAEQDSPAIQALVRLDFLGAQQARRELEIAAQTNPEARKALEEIDGNKEA